MDLTDEEVLALRDLLVYGHSSTRAEAASRVYARVSRLARKVEVDRKGGQREATAGDRKD